MLFIVLAMNSYAQKQEYNVDQKINRENINFLFKEAESAHFINNLSIQLVIAGTALQFVGLGTKDASYNLYGLLSLQASALISSLNTHRFVGKQKKSGDPSNYFVWDNYIKSWACIGLASGFGVVSATSKEDTSKIIFGILAAPFGCGAIAYLLSTPISA